MEDIALSSVIDYAIIVDGVITNIVKWDGDESKWRPQIGYAIPLSEAISQNIPQASSPKNTVITASEFVQRIASISPEIITRIWNSEHPAAAIAATRLFTLSGEVDLKEGGALREMLQALQSANLISADEVNKIIGDT